MSKFQSEIEFVVDDTELIQHVRCDKKIFRYI